MVFSETGKSRELGYPTYNTSLYPSSGHSMLMKEIDGRNAMNVETKRAKAERLRELHRRESILVLPNAWDPLSVRAFESCGFPAVATTSAGIT